VKRLAQMTAVALATLLVVGALWQFRTAVVLFILSLALSAALRPLVERQVDRGWPRAVALILVYVLALALLGALVWSVGQAVLNDLRLLLDETAMAYERIWQTWPEGNTFQQMVARALPAPTDLYDALAGPGGEGIIQGLIGATSNLLQIIARFAIVLVLSLYWSLDQARFERLWLAALPAERRARAREVWRAIETGVGGYVRSQLAQSALAGALLGIGFSLMGLPYAALLAVVSALAWLIPWLGLVVGVLLVLAAGWTTSPALGVAAAAYTAAVFALLALAVEPRLYDRRQYSSVLVVLVLLAMAETFGIMGMLAAPPLAAALQILFTHLFAPAVAPAEHGVRPRLQALEQRLASVRAELAEQEPPPQQLENMLERLDALIGQAGAVLDEPARRPGSGNHKASRTEAEGASGN
jgi:putative permease